MPLLGILLFASSLVLIWWGLKAEWRNREKMEKYGVLIEEGSIVLLDVLQGLGRAFRWFFELFWKPPGEKK